jgi:hypothetical protein
MRNPMFIVVGYNEETKKMKVYIFRWDMGNLVLRGSEERDSIYNAGDEI